MLAVVTFHYVRPESQYPERGIRGITPEQLAAQIEQLAGAGEIIAGTELVAAIRGETSLPERAIMLTFDDGLREHFEYALPVLERAGVPATFFANTAPLADGRVSTVHKVHQLRAGAPPVALLETATRALAARGIDPVEPPEEVVRSQYPYDPYDDARQKYLFGFGLGDLRDQVVQECFDAQFGADGEREMVTRLYMDTEQLRAVAQRGWLGSHAHEHVDLAALDKVGRSEQLSRSAQLLEEWTGCRPVGLAYPFGHRPQCPLPPASEVGQAGYAYAMTMERATNADLRTPFHLARWDTVDVAGGKAERYSAEGMFAAPRPGWFV